MFFKGAFCSFLPASVAYIRWFHQFFADCRFIAVAVLITHTAEPAPVDTPLVFAVRADVCPGTGKAVRAIIVTMSETSAFQDRIIPLYFSCYRRAVLVQNHADGFEGDMLVKAGRNRLPVFQCQVLIPVHPASFPGSRRFPRLIQRAVLHGTSPE